MPTKCFVPGCRSNYNANSKVRVYGFPKDEELKRLWLQAINREDKREPSKSSKVCGNHFKPEDIITVSEGLNTKTQVLIQIPLQKYRLVKDAVPSVFINLYPVRKRKPTQLSSVTENSSEEIDNSQELEAETSSHISPKMRTCSVPGCRSNFEKPYVSVFHFPKSPGFRNLWLKKIGCPLMNIKENSVVCIKHFEKDCIINKLENEINGGSRKRIGIKPGAVPTIFEKEDVDNLSDDTDKSQDNMKVKDVRSVSTSEASKASDDEEEEDNEESMDSAASDKEDTTCTTTPFISIIKPTDCQADEPSTTEEIFEDSTSSPIKQSPNSKPSRQNSISRPRNVSSPYKNLPPVSVSLTDEDSLNAHKEVFKSSKRSLSASSNSGIASSEIGRVQPKRRKVEKPAPTVIGKLNDCYCWVCHRENVVLSCIACPRAYHIKCANENGSLTDWVCPECKRTLTAEDVDTRSSVLSEISLDKLCTLLRFSLNKMKHRAGVAFHQPVSLEHYPMYLHYVIHPMDFSLLEKNIKQKLYGCTEAFLSDVKWILHNSCVFNGSQHPLSTNAKSMVKACDNDMQEIEVCPDCFMHNIVRNKYWFSEVCQKPHPLVWAKLKGFPYWPAKVVRIADGNVDARFFGAHDRAWVPISQCYHLSKEMPTSSKPKKKGNYETALDELSVHVQLLIQKYGSFEYAPYRTSFDPEDKQLMYHGIDIDLVNKEEAQKDTPSNMTSELAALYKEDTGISKELDESKDSDLKPEADTNLASKSSSGETISSTKLNNKEAEDEPKPETSQSSDKQPSPLSDRKKIELALQRIQGYISNDIEEDKEEEKDLEEEKDSNSVKTPSNYTEEPLKKDSESDKEDKEENMCLSDLIKARTLPPVDLTIIDDLPIDENPDKDKMFDMGNVKKDSFALKLIETIASCKAKLGISGDLDKSDSHDSDSDEEDSGGEDGRKRSSKRTKVRSRATSDASSTEEDASDESSSESDAESVSSNTDIEMIEEIGDEGVEKETENTSELQADHQGIKSTTDEEESSKFDATSASVSVSDKTNSPNKLDNVVDENAPKIPPSIVQESDKSNNLTVETEKSSFPSPAARSRSVSSNALQSSTDDLTDTDIQLDGIEHQQPVSKPEQNLAKSDAQPTEDANKTINDEMEDDDIYICPIVKPPTPPLICLDDGTETEPEPEEKTESISVRLPPPEKNISPENTQKYISILKSAKLIPQNARKTAVKRPIRADSSEESSDEEYVFSAPKVPLSGAIRTFKNRDKGTLPAKQVPSKPDVPYSGILVQNEAGSRNDVNQAHGILDNADNFAQNIEVTTEPDGVTELAVKNAEILKLKKKLSCIFSAFQLQQWKSNQEKAELRHNMNLIVMEMRASLEADKKQTIENLTKTLEREKQRCIEETKKKQWCAYCQQESRYGCCWNTSYCTVACQKRHFSDHRNVCTQLKPKSNDQEVVKPSLPTTDEKKKVLVVNVIPNKDAKSIGDATFDNSKQFAISKVMSPKQSIHLVSTSSAQSNSVQKMSASEKQQYYQNKRKLDVAQEEVYREQQKKRLAKPQKIKDLSEEQQQKQRLKWKLKARERRKKRAMKLKDIGVKPSEDVTTSHQLEMKEEELQRLKWKLYARKRRHKLALQLNDLAGKPSEDYVLTTTQPSSSTSLSQKNTSKVDTSDVESDNDKAPDSASANKQDHASTSQQADGQQSLEEFYFPSPPTVRFEGLDTALPDESVHFDDISEASENRSSDNELTIAEESSAEEDLILSENDEVDNEMVSIGRGVDVKAKYLNKCLIYGRDAKKLTRCLVDVLFTGSILSMCSAFGNKSNVTKLTRAALPYKKVSAIIDFVQNRFPKTSRSEIVLVINMKCKEARNLACKTETSSKSKKMTFRRLLAKEQKEDETEQQDEKSTDTKDEDPDASTSKTSTSKPQSTHTVTQKNPPSIVNLKTIQRLPTIVQTAPAKPNILRMSRQILIRPKYALPPAGKVLLAPTSTIPFRNPTPKNPTPTVRSLLNIRQSLDGKEKTQVLFPVGMIKKAVIANPASGSVEGSSAGAISQRPLLIIGSPQPVVCTAQPLPVTQNK